MAMKFVAPSTSRYKLQNVDTKPVESEENLKTKGTGANQQHYVIKVAVGQEIQFLHTSLTLGRFNSFKALM